MDEASTGTFDMNSWQGLTKVLKAGRDANMNPETYAEFRDSVLRYAQSGGTDTALRARIEELLPEFKDMAPQVEKKPVPEKKEGVQKQVTPPANLPMEEKKPEPPKPAPEKKPEPPKPAPEPPQHVPPVAPAGELMSSDEARERIAEIKHAVTEYVGNPVTLVAENETVGREYMRTLLAALKAVSGTAPGTLRQSMHDLEAAYKKVLEIKVGQPKAEPIMEEKKPEPPKPAPEKKPEPPKPEPKSEPAPEKKPVPIVEREHTIPSLDERIKMVKEKVVQRPKAPEPKEEKKPEPPKPAPEKKPEPPKPQKKGKVFSEAEIEKDVEQVLKKAESEKPFATPDLSEGFTQPVPKGVSDDLFTPEIEEGLDQLLKEWRIFKGGKKLFGKGPVGMEHPLYQQLKDIIMFDVIAGHFEGAQKEVVLSIRDYANAWRNEQGIVYAPSETFEHYLRRVIRRIIKRST